MERGTPTPFHSTKTPKGEESKMYKVTKIVENLYENSRTEKIKLQTFCKTIYELFEAINKQLTPEMEFKIHKSIKKETLNKQDLDLKVLNHILKLKCDFTKIKINQDFKEWKQNQFVVKYDLFVEKKRSLKNGK